MNNILANRKIEKGIIVPIEVKRDDDKVAQLTDTYIDISYKSKETPSRILSNLYKYPFDYFGKTAFSVEAALQSLKFKDDDVRFACYEYSGVDAWHLRGMSPYDWQKDGILYSPLGQLDRYRDGYQNFLDELYYLAFKNSKYRFSLEQSFGKELDHLIGEDSVNRTTLTRTEFISRLYALRYCAVNQINETNKIIRTLRDVRQELK